MLHFTNRLHLGEGVTRIEYYARVLKRNNKTDLFTAKRKQAPRAHDDYLKIKFSEIKKLPRAIRNIVPRRISFGFTTLKCCSLQRIF